jgi:hypothetical protein
MHRSYESEKSSRRGVAPIGMRSLNWRDEQSIEKAAPHLTGGESAVCCVDTTASMVQTNTKSRI